MPPYVPLNGPQAPPAPETPSGPPARGPLFWAGQALLLPFRLMGLLLLVLLIPGVVQLWSLPTLAEREQLDPTLLALRAIDQEQAVTPLLPLGYRQAARAGLIDLCAPGDHYEHQALTMFTANFYSLHAVGCMSQRTPDGGYEHVVTYNHCPPHTVEATTPHLTVSADEIARARQAVARLFPDKAQAAEVLDWGESLFWAEWLAKNPLYDVARVAIPKPEGGTEDERLWLAWIVLRGDSSAAEDELPRLPELFEQAFSNAADRDAALQWAQGLYEREEADFSALQATARAKVARRKASTAKVEAWDEHNPREEVYAALKRVLPPKTRWTYLWLIYRYAGLSAASREAARQHWLSRFPPDAEVRVLAFGRAIAEERRAAGEPLPPVPETLPLLCAAERLVGSDPYGRRCRDVLTKECGNDPEMLKFAIYSAYPNDEIFFLLASRDALHMQPLSGNSGSLQKRLERVAGSSIAPLIGSLGFVTLLQWIVVPLLLRNEARVRWRKHVEGRGKEPWWLSALSVLVFAGIGCLAAPLTLPQVVGLQADSYGELFLGAVAATAVGGVLIASCRRLLAVLLVACGVDVEATWIDEALGVLVGALVLFHFGNDLLSIVLFASSDVAPGLVLAAIRRARAGRPTAAASRRPAAGIALGVLMIVPSSAIRGR